MRYTINEGNSVLGKFYTGDTVTLILYDMSTGDTVPITNTCTEIGTLGVFKWATSQITTPPTVFKEYLWVMSNGELNQMGKIVLGGYPDRTEENAFQLGAVWIDTDSSIAGTTYPNGTLNWPVNNFADAYIIAGVFSLRVFQVKGGITVGASYDMTGKVFVEGGGEATITFTPGCITADTVLKGHIHVIGTLNGHTHLEGVHLRTGVTGFEGLVMNALIDSGIYYPASTGRVDLNTLYSIGATPVIFDFSGSTSILTVVNYSGDLTIRNKTGPEAFRINMRSGILTVESSCTAGSIEVYGFGHVVDNSVGCTVINDSTYAHVEAVEVNVNTMMGKLPTNYIMGSSVVTSKDDEIDAIKTKTDNLNFTTGNVHSHMKAQDNLALTAQQKLDVNTEVDAAFTDYDGPTHAEMTAELDTIETEVLTHPTLAEIEASSILAKEATLTNGTYGLSALKALIDAIDTSLELANRFDEIKGVGWTNETLKAIKDGLSSITVDNAAIADAVWDEAIVDHIGATTFGGKNQKVVPSETINDYKADISALAIEANVETHVINSLNTYDPPTRAEVTADKDEVITEVNANEAKLDTLLSRVTASVYTAWTKLADVAIAGSETVGSLLRKIYDNLNETVSSRSSHSATDVDTVLSASHGAGSWDAVADTAAIITHLTDIKGGGWSIETLVTIEAAILALNDLAQSDVVTALGSYGAATAANVSAAELNIRGSDSDTLETLSDQLDVVQVDTDGLQVQMARLLGLSKENVVIDTPVYDGNNNLVSARTRTFPTKADAIAGTNVIATYTTTVTATGINMFSKWEMVIEP